MPLLSIWFELQNCFIFHNGFSLVVSWPLSLIISQCMGGGGWSCSNYLPCWEFWSRRDQWNCQRKSRAFPYWTVRGFWPIYRCQSFSIVLMYFSCDYSFRYEMRFNMKTGLASQRKLSESAVDFPRVNESYTGRYRTSLHFKRLSCLAIKFCSSSWVNFRPRYKLHWIRRGAMCPFQFMPHLS